MNISRNKRLSLGMVFIILAVYNIIAFLLPLDRGGMFWTGYGFSMVAILLTAGVSFYALGRDGLKSKVYGCPLLFLAWIYLIVQLIIGILEMVLVFIPFQYGIVLNVILFGVCMIGLIATDITKEEVERIEEKVKGKVFYIKMLQDDIEGMSNQVADEITKLTLNDLAEAIRYSDPMTSPQLAAIENKIEAKVAVLSEAVDAMDLSKIKTTCDEIQQLFAERNRKCKTIK
jgi:hypothetical protein